MYVRRFGPLRHLLEPARDSASRGMPVRTVAGCGSATLLFVATASIAAILATTRASIATVSSPPVPVHGATVVPAQATATPRSVPGEERPASTGGAPAEPVLVAVAIDPMSVAGTPLSTPLLIQLEPGDARTPDDLFVLVSGLPGGVELTRGEKNTDGIWRLRQDDLPGLELRAGSEYAGPLRFELDLTAVAAYGDGRQSATLAAVPVRIFKTPLTQTASATDRTGLPARAGGPPPTVDTAPPMPEQVADAAPEDAIETAVLVVPSLAPSPRAETSVEEPATELAVARVPSPSDALMIRRGDELFARGDLAGARLFYERAAAGGSADGALAMGKTHDPVVFERIRVRGLTPDPDRAADWYRRAGEAGNDEAEDRLQALTTWVDRQADQGDITR